MKKLFKKSLAVIMVVVMTLTTAPLSGFVGMQMPELSGVKNIAASVSAFFSGLSVKAEAAETYSGTCGDNLTWSLDTETGVLEIVGTGEMYDYDYRTYAPWFSYRSYIETVSFPDGLTTIGIYSFYDCDILKSVIIPDGVTSIGVSAFNQCDSLTKAKIPDSVTVISSGLFGECISLMSVIIPNGLTKIESYAFYGCTSLKNISIPDSLTSIGQRSFQGCTSLESITIPDSVTEISGMAFANCSSLKTVYIGKGVTRYLEGLAVFAACPSLKKIDVATDNASYLSDSGVLYTKDKTKLVCFPAAKDINDYTFPLSLTEIGPYACSSVSDFKIPDGITTIGALAFVFATFESIIIPDSVETIDYLAFGHCQNLKYIHIASGETSPITLNQNEHILYGSSAYICSTTESCYAKTYAEANGIEFKVCSGHDTDEPTTDEPTTEEPTTEEPTTEEPTTDEPTTEEPTTEEPTTEEPATEEPTTEEPTTEEPTTEEPTTEHKHTSKTVTVPASCTVNGMEYTVCAECGKPIGDVTIIPASHTYGDWETVTEATCKAEGKRIKKCTVCGEILQTETIDKKAHTPGEWETVLEPTVDADGKRVKKCTVCGEVLEEETIAKLKVSTAVDEKTGIEMDYAADDYEGEVEINVEESFDGTAFDIIDTTLNSTQKFIYDITMTVNGVATQPNGKVTVKIPLPSGYDPARTFVYHINSNTGKLEPMYAEYIDGYLVFETTHFSYYALVEVVDVELKINKTSTNKINYGDTLVLTVGEIEIPEGYAIEWFVEGAGVSTKVNADGTECRVTSIANGSVTITAKLVDETGEPVTNADGEEIFDQITLTSKAGFWQKFVSFFKNLFGINRVIY